MGSINNSNVSSGLTMVAVLINLDQDLISHRGDFYDDDFWDLFPTTLEELDDSILSQYLPQTCFVDDNVKHIEDDHDYYKKTPDEINTEINETEKRVKEKKYKSKKIFRQLQSDNKVFRRKMKNRITAQERRKRKREFLEEMENNFEMTKVHIQELVVTYKKLKKLQGELRKNIRNARYKLYQQETLSFRTI